MMACRTGCRTQDHKSWGECARAANINIGYDAYQSKLDHAPMTQKAWDRELELMRDTATQGIVPDTTRTKDIQAAVDVSNKYGKPYQGQGIERFENQQSGRVNV